MASSVSEWDTNPNNNTLFGSASVAEGGLPSDINNAIREITAQIATYLQNNIFPVGCVYETTISTNPADTLGFGTWELFGEGRVTVCVGSNGEQTWVSAEERGSETHRLVADEVPSHTHTFAETGSTGNTNLDFTLNNFAGSQIATATGALDLTVGDFVLDTNDDDAAFLSAQFNGNHSHTFSVSGTTSARGGGGTHNNVQPSIALYRWTRTA